MIKKIKEAEVQAQEIIEQARRFAASKAEKSGEQIHQSLAQAELQRKKTIEAAVAAAETEGLTEIELLKAQAEGGRQQLRDNVQGKTADAVAKVTDYLKG